MDTLDRDLWAAGQSIAASRQERVAIYRALNNASTVRASIERNAVATRKKYDQAKLEYQQLFKHYQTLYEQHGILQDRHNHVCADLARALEDQGRLQTVTITLDDQNALKEALELELQQAKDELAALEDWKSQELRSRDLAIDNLQGDIQEKDAQLAQFAEKLHSIEDHQNQILAETTRDCEIKDAEISRLKTDSAAHEQALNKEQDRSAALSSELESARLFIQALEGFQSQMEKIHEQLQQENHSLKETLEMTESSDELEINTQAACELAETELERLRDENRSLTQQLDTVKKALVARFPSLHDNFNNLSSVLAENGEERKGKKRRGTK
ncbi:hypothetical protein ACJ41O_005995 [Fusarium nematophilum]